MIESGFRRQVPFGTFLVVCALCVISSVSSLNVLRSTVATSGNETIMVDNLNTTGQLLKRAGEFASRALWVRKGKFVLPSGTILTLAPKITIPAFRRKAFKGGLNSDIQATWFLYVNCDKLGITSDMHPFPFDRPPFYPFGPLMRPIETKDDKGKNDQKEKEKKPMHKEPYSPFMKYPAPIHKPHHDENGMYKVNSEGSVLTFYPVQKRTGSAQPEKPKPSRRRNPRSIMSLPPPEELPGGERAVLLPGVESLMATFGFEGRGCMLRAICEIHQYPVREGYGLLGEMITLFFSISQSSYAESHMPEYLKAEEAGRAGNCADYRKLCAKSIFKWEVEKKRQDVDTNEVLVSPYRSKFGDDDEL